jgi:hypothetical protein
MQRLFISLSQLYSDPPPGDSHLISNLFDTGLIDMHPVFKILSLIPLFNFPANELKVWNT